MSKFKFVQLSDGTIAQAVVVVDANGNPIVGGSLIKGQVTNYANLPAAASHINEYWLIEQSSGVYFINFKQRGLYISNGTTWLPAPNVQNFFSDLNQRTYNESDNTKQLKPDVSEITSGQTRVLTYPDKDARLIYTDNVLHVSPNGGDFTSIKNAVDSITDNDETHRYTVLVSPGIYTENNPIQCKSYVNIEARSMHTVRVVAGNANQDLFTAVNLSYLVGLSMVGVSGVGKYAVNHSVVGEIVIKDCVWTDCVNGLIMNNTNAFANVLSCALYTPTGSMTCGICVMAGNLTLDFLKVVTTSTITTILEADGTNSIITLNNIISFSPNVTNGIVAKNGCSMSGYGTRMIGLYDAMIIEGDNTQVRFDTVQIFNCQNDGFRINNTGTGIELALFATTISGCANLNFNVLNPNSTTSGNGFTEIIKGFVVDGAGFYAYLLDIAETDEGLNIFGELHVGSIEQPAESTLGEGDSVSRGIVAYTYDGVDYVDISDDVKSPSSSSFTFPNLLVNTAIYISSELVQSSDVFKHQGIKVNVLTAAVLGTGNFIVEYWNGSAWVEVNVMECHADNKYYPHAKSIFEHTGSHQIRYDSELANDSWGKNDPMLYGTDLYWIRFRIESAITTAPIFEQWKTHASRSEINSDGWIEYFGKARPQGQLGLNFTTGKPFEGAMLDQTIYVSQDIAQGFTKNKFTATGDKLGISGYLPFDLDTSSKIKLQWSGMASASQTIEWTIRWAWVKDGDAYSTSEPGAITNSRSIIVSKAITLNLISTFEALLDVSEMISRRDGDFGDELWVSIQPSTLSGQFSLTNSQALYTKWSQGGHI